jgi:hypothetical protein
MYLKLIAKLLVVKTQVLGVDEKLLPVCSSMEPSVEPTRKSPMSSRCREWPFSIYGLYVERKTREFLTANFVESQILRC